MALCQDKNTILQKKSSRIGYNIICIVQTSTEVQQNSPMYALFVETRHLKYIIIAIVGVK